MDVNVLTKGNRELIKMYGNLISLDYESAATLADTLSTNDSPHMNAITNEARVVFQTILAKKAWKIEEHKDLNPTMMDMGEKVFLGYAFTFAVRNALPFDLPVVFDKAYEMSRLNLEKWCSCISKTANMSTNSPWQYA